MWTDGIHTLVFLERGRMGLAVEVGYLADLGQNDEEGAQSFRDGLAQLNSFLASQGLSPHNEPETCEVLSFDMYGYSGLHYLRRIAAHLDLRGILPPPGEEDASEDEIMAEYYRLADQASPGFFGRLFGKRSRARTFDHLMLHSDAEGYYLPQGFRSVLFPADEFQIPGSMIGSSHRLHEECMQLAAALQLPPDLDPE